jgi:hypothetical protein
MPRQLTRRLALLRATSTSPTWGALPLGLLRPLFHAWAHLRAYEFAVEPDVYTLAHVSSQRDIRSQEQPGADKCNVVAH